MSPPLDEALVHQLVDLHAVVHVTDPVFHAAVVFSTSRLPPRCATAGRTGWPHRRARRPGSSTSPQSGSICRRGCSRCGRLRRHGWAAQTTDATGVDADAGALGNVTHDGAGGGIDGIQAVVTLDQHAGAELAGRGAHPLAIGVGREILKVETAS